MIGPILGALIGTGIKVGGNLLASKLSGNPSSGLNQAGLPTFGAGGLRGAQDPDGTFRVRADGDRQALVGGIASTFPEQAGLIRGLRGSVAPGFSALREARLGSLDSARRRTIGNLRDNLQRRRIGGSSFAGDAIARAEREFAGDEVEAITFLQELELTNNLINQEFEVARGEFEAQLGELNLQAEIATKIAGQATAQLGANARLKAELAAKSAQGTGKFFGNIAGDLTKGITAGLNGGTGTSGGSSFSLGPATT
jgi:hypothetical protein